MPKCKGCDIEIEWQQRDNKYVPIEPTTGQVHKCPAYSKHRTTKQEVHTGILTETDDSGATVYYNGKERRYAFGEGRAVFLSTIQNSGYAVPVTVEIAHDAKGFVTHLKVIGPVHPDDIDKVEETRQEQKQTDPEPETNTDFETAMKLKKDLESLQTVPHDTTDAGEDDTDNITSPSHPLPDDEEHFDRRSLWDLTIGCTINLTNYENIKIEVDGPAEDREEMIAYLDDTLEQFGRNNPATKDLIDSYRARVLKKKEEAD
jgi:ribosomal protein S28E/S33